MKKIINGLFGMLLMLAVAAMPLPVIGSEQPTAEEMEAINNELANLSPEQLEQMFNEYLATLSPEEQEKLMEEYNSEMAALDESSDEIDKNLAEQEVLAEEIAAQPDIAVVEADDADAEADESDELPESAE